MDEKALKTKIQELINKFEKVKAQGKYKSYNEENTKKDFILPLFRALGWKEGIELEGTAIKDKGYFLIKK